MIREDCFAYIKNKNKCNALHELYCAKCDKCSFFKTREQYIKDNLKAMEMNKDVL